MALTNFDVGDIVSRESINRRFNEFDAMFPLKISDGGTGATSVEQARKNLGLYSVEDISFTGGDTITLSRSIREYSYIRVFYRIANDYKTGGSTYFSQDVLSSTDIHSLCINAYHERSNSGGLLIFASALMHVSGNGYTIWLTRNQGFFVDRDNGDTYVAPAVPWWMYSIDPKIQITHIEGYK